MRIQSEHTMVMNLRDSEIDAMREIVRLAHERLASAPKTQFHGCPLQRQAGLVGPQLIEVVDLIDHMSRVMNVRLTTPVSYPIATT